MGLQHWARSTFTIIVLVVEILMTLPSQASESLAQDSPVPHQTVTGLSKGTWEMSMMSGYTYTYRRTDAHVTKLMGVPVILGGGLVVTNPIGTAWYQGQVTLGGEMLFTQYVEPLSTYIVALTPTVKYTFLVFDRLRPYVEAGAGVVWTDLGDRIPEKGSQFNFNIQVGVGLSYVVMPTTAFNVSYRFQHISNAGTAHPNHGIDAGLVLIGLSKFF